MIKIEKEWDNIREAIREALKLISSFGFSRDNIVSNNLMIPIAYYLKIIGIPKNFTTVTSNINDRKNIKLWLVSALLKRVFSFSPDGVLKPTREIIKKNTSNGFPLDQIFMHFKGSNRSLQFTDDDISNLLYSKYGHSDTLVILSILYPWADLRNNFHIDHMYPQSEFTHKKLKAKGIPEKKIDYFIDSYNFIGNLQLLEEIPNIEKKAMDFDKWLNEKIPVGEQSDYRKKNYVPVGSLNFENFDTFLEEREKLIIKKLQNELKK